MTKLLIQRYAWLLLFVKRRAKQEWCFLKVCWSAKKPFRRHRGSRPETGRVSWFRAFIGDLMRTNLTSNLDLWSEENLENREKCPPLFFNETKQCFSPAKGASPFAVQSWLSALYGTRQFAFDEQSEFSRGAAGSSGEHFHSMTGRGPEQTELASSQKWIPLLRSVCSHRLEKRNMPPLRASHLISPLQGAFVDRFFHVSFGGSYSLMGRVGECGEGKQRATELWPVPHVGCLYTWSQRLDTPLAPVCRHHYMQTWISGSSLQLLFVVHFCRKDHCWLVPNRLEFMMIQKSEWKTY